ncbi:hypothetical protein [Comamonas odontotermitis]|uniref:hypothetical protein n=1 Tax=Comamonas odontotermitis TaxID=379895 RepID=UPI001CC6AC81|nr:hypothetical protein [Comamonas odontotermitis]UBB15421.1 hypothetical protein LAD35_11100 [Comamonas odontotermitis]
MDLLDGVTWALCFVALALSLTAFVYVFNDRKQRKEREARSLELFAAGQSACIEARDEVFRKEAEKVREFHEALSASIYEPPSLRVQSACAAHPTPGSRSFIGEKYSDTAQKAENANRHVASAMGDLLAQEMPVRDLSVLIKALEAAHHELATLHGLKAFDGATPSEVWSIDTSLIKKQIYEALWKFA